MDSSQTSPLSFLRVLVAAVSLILSMFVAFYSQASTVSEEAQRVLFWQLLIVALVDIAIVIFIWRSKKITLRWFTIIPAFAACASLLEMTCRTWLSM